LNQAEEKVGAVVAAGEEFFSLLQEIFLARAEVKAYFPSRLLIDKKDRTEEIWQQIETVGDNFKVSINLLSQTLFSLLEQVTLLSLQDGEDMFGVDQIKGLASNFLTIADLAETWLKPPDNDYVTWLTFTAGDKKPSLHMAPIDMGELLYDTLLFNKKSIVFTSATLSVANSFAYFKKNIGLDLLPEPPIELLVSSPFYYNEQALFAICTDLPDWTKQSEVQCIEAIGSTLIKLIESSEGRALILFTSHAQLKAVYRRINKPLSQKGLTVLAHGINGNPSQLLNRLKEEENCCLLGASSFWEGIDVVGSALSLVAVVRLPFWPPTDPLMYSRMKKLEDEGYNSFNAYSLPQAVIRFKQGFGRLIRSGYDKGVFCVLDRRLVEKYYGRTFVESLPEMQIVCDTHEEIAEHVRQWLK
jgi:ATP-dependent DNA helicase DinG